MGQITELIHKAHDGDRVAFDALFQALYPALRRIAHARLASHQRNVLMDTTVLLHESYLKFLRAGQLKPADRGHFLAYSAQMMRSIIVDTVRAAQRECRGGGAEHVALDTEFGDAAALPEDEILDVDAALAGLAAIEPRAARVVEMRYFGGLNEAEIAAALGVTDRTVRRDWEKARLLLAHALKA